MKPEILYKLLSQLTTLPHETEWVEFKHNHVAPQDIGEYISALANSATLSGKDVGYLVWGVEDKSHKIIGTTFKPHDKKVGNQDLQNWLVTQLTPRINFDIYEFKYNDNPIVIFKIHQAFHQPVRFRGIEYIRMGSYRQKLKDFPEKERELWRFFDKKTFENKIAKEQVSSQEVLTLLNYPAYFEMTQQPLPDNRRGILKRLESEKFILQKHTDTYDITNLGGILLANNLNSFKYLGRKAIRVILYRGNNKVETVREQTGVKGYAAGYEGVISFINNLLPENEVIGQALRKNVRMYPEIAIRELAANAIIHQDFNLTGTGPTIEIFSGRIEITNPGIPLIDTLRFIGEPPQSRNEILASFMRRINICEERGSGIAKVIHWVEVFQLPAPEFTVTSNHTKVVLFAHRDLSGMDKDDKIRACYQHACLRYISNDRMTNTSLRGRFSIKPQNYSMASRIISDSLDAGLIRRSDPDSKSKKHAKYVPFWA